VSNTDLIERNKLIAGEIEYNGHTIWLTRRNEGDMACIIWKGDKVVARSYETIGYYETDLTVPEQMEVWKKTIDAGSKLEWLPPIKNMKDWFKR
jgi:hypothetical protein